ncbi:MAG TPA: 30S ribosomal protein S27ae [Candidatus Thermoplasmatota archaeon]
MAEKGASQKKVPSAALRKLYQIKDGAVVRTHTACPKCGPGRFLAEHKDRLSCGHCGHTQFRAAPPAQP